MNLFWETDRTWNASAAEGFSRPLSPPGSNRTNQGAAA